MGLFLFMGANGTLLHHRKTMSVSNLLRTAKAQYDNLTDLSGTTNWVVSATGGEDHTDRSSPDSSWFVMDWDGNTVPIEFETHHDAMLAKYYIEDALGYDIVVSEVLPHMDIEDANGIAPDADSLALAVYEATEGDGLISPEKAVAQSLAAGAVAFVAVYTLGKAWERVFGDDGDEATDADVRAAIEEAER